MVVWCGWGVKRKESRGDGYRREREGRGEGRREGWGVGELGWGGIGRAS